MLYVGPIFLTGSGSLYDPDPAPYGGEGIPGSRGVTFQASGSNGTDSVSINMGDLPLGFDLGMLLPIVGDGTSVSASAPMCIQGPFMTVLVCNAVIDGIGGLGAFTNIGGGIGWVQVYAIEDIPNVPRGIFPGPLLAQAEVISDAIFTSVTPGAPDDNGPPIEFQSTFDIVSSPEPSTGVMGFIGVAALACLGLRKILRTQKQPPLP